MKKETERLIVKATAGLELRDIVLFETRFERLIKNPISKPFEAIQQQKRSVKYSTTEMSGNSTQTRIFEVVVSFGVRLIKPHEKGDQLEAPEIVAQIEADYVIDYDVRAKIDEKALKAFAEFNAVHNAWPFWRQHVFDLCQRGHLPQFKIPLFSGISPKRSAASTKEERNTNKVDL